MQIHIIYLLAFIVSIYTGLEVYKIHLAQKNKRISNQFLTDSFYEILHLISPMLPIGNQAPKTQTYTGKSFSDMQKEIADQKLHFHNNLMEGNKTALIIWLQDSEYFDILKDWAIEKYPNNETLIDVLKAINLADYAN